ncbi:MAG: sulfotransferase family 2 domain-containing protein [Nitrososphaera sp.]|nr:sulfotransferase family 2 domain-containing protein [Nitrososphaera sp.]
MKTYRDTVFIHIPRTSGTSLKWALNNKIQDLEYLQAQYHKPAIERRELMGLERWHACYKFTIVRNPWERAVSWYYLCRDNSPFKEWLLKVDVGQARYCTEDGQIIVDDVFKYETLDHRLEELCSKAHWPLIQRLPAINSTAHEPYQTYYDLETREYVASQCAFEIEHFKYIFETPAS